MKSDKRSHDNHMHETKTAAFSQCQEEAHDFQISTFETVKAIQISQCKVLNY